MHVEAMLNMQLGFKVLWEEVITSYFNYDIDDCFEN